MVNRLGRPCGRTSPVNHRCGFAHPVAPGEGTCSKPELCLAGMHSLGEVL